MGHSLIRDQFTRLDALQQRYRRNREYLFDEITFKSDHAYESVYENSLFFLTIKINFLIKFNNTRVKFSIIGFNSRSSMEIWHLWFRITK
jgi:hypothetical protein